MPTSPEIVCGPTMVANWVWPTQAVGAGTLTAGTANLAPDYRTVDIKPTVDIVDGTAGADTSKKKYMGMRDINVSMTLVAQVGGTALNAAIDAGVSGTLTIWPEGTAGGKPVFTVPAFSTGGQYSYPYNTVAEISVTFEGQGNYTIA